MRLHGFCDVCWKSIPKLAREAEETPRSLLQEVKDEEIAAEIEDEIRTLDYDDVNARAGRHEFGYVEPTEAGWEILEERVEPFREDMKRHLELGLDSGGAGNLQRPTAGLLSAQRTCGWRRFRMGVRLPGGGGRPRPESLV